MSYYKQPLTRKPQPKASPKAPQLQPKVQPKASPKPQPLDLKTCTIEPVEIVKAKLFEKGFIAFTNISQFYYVNNIKDIFTKGSVKFKFRFDYVVCE